MRCSGLFVLAATTFVATLATARPAEGQALSDPPPSVPAEFVRSFFGAVHLSTDDMHLADDVGAAWGRLGMRWRTHEPEPGRYDFSMWDTLHAVAREHGVLMLPVLNQTTEWASSAPPDAPERRRYVPSEEGIEEWKAYVRAAVERFPDIEYFEIWNEPNIDWFLRADANYRAYVDRLLIPAAEVLHAHGRKVVAPSYTLEWPADRWPRRERGEVHRHDLDAVMEDLDRWLSYHDAWRYVDVLSVHYSKGDVEPGNGPSLMPVYDHVYDEWIRTGRLEGIWNTEEGLTAVEAGTAGFVSLEPWERAPYAQWVPRYMLPVLHWALQHGWEERHQYKVSWYHMKAGPGRSGTLRKTNLLEEAPGGPVPSGVGHAMRTLSRLLTGRDGGSGSGPAERVGVFSGRVQVGFGLSDDTTAMNHFAPYRFKSYAFRLERGGAAEVVVATWLDLPGIEFAREEVVGGIEVVLEGMEGPEAGEVRVSRIDYVTGEEALMASVEPDAGGTLRFEVPRTADPILYLRLRR